jgi:hypothetical protein
MAKKVSGKAATNKAASKTTTKEAARQFVAEAAANIQPTDDTPVRSNGKPAGAGNQQPKTPRRSAKWVWKHDSGMFGVLRITHEMDNGEMVSWRYFVRRLSNQVLTLEKLDPKDHITYVVMINGTSSCNCKVAQTGKADEKCKHICALEALKASGRL